MKRIILAALLVIMFALKSTTHEYYPLEIGYWWHYEGIEVDSLGDPIPGTEYDSYSTVIGDTLISGFNYYVMQDSSNQGGVWQTWDDSYIRSAGDTIKILIFFLDDSSNHQEADVAILPAPAGFTWMVMFLDTFMVDMGDTLHVVVDWTSEILDTDPIMVQGETYNDVYHLYDLMHMEITFPFPPITLTLDQEMEIWAAHNVGPVRFLQFPTTGFEPEPGTLEELSDYMVPVARREPTPEPNWFALQPAYPNPFNPSTRIGFSLNQPSQVEVTVFDLSGQKIEELLEDWRLAGSYQVDFDATGLPSGIYLVRLKAGDQSAAQKLILLK